jgi:hypothetical protein
MPTSLFLPLVAQTCDEVCVAEGFACSKMGKKLDFNFSDWFKVSLAGV